MNMNTITPKRAYMKVQIRTMNLNQTKGQKTQSQSVNMVNTIKKNMNNMEVMLNQVVFMF